MSVYKAVSNYYVEVLDFLHGKIKKYQTLNTYFKKITNEEKKELLIKISDMLLKINMLFVAREKYWMGRRKEQHAIFSIFITIAVVVGVVLYGILYMRVFKMKEYSFYMQDGSINQSKFRKAFLNYSTIFMLVLTVFILMIMNAQRMRNLFNAEAKKTRREGEFYLKYIFERATNNIEKPLFQLAMNSRGKLFATEMIDGDELPPMGCAVDEKMDKDAAVSVSNFFNCKTSQVNYLGAFDAYKTDLEKSLVAFYDEGRGYSKVRDIYILSGPMPILKETRRIMENYYYFSHKDRHGKTEKPQSDAKDKEFLKKELVVPLQAHFNSKPLPQDPTAFQKSMLKAEFASQFEDVKNLFMYVAVYSYQLYIGARKTSSKFPSSLIDSFPDKAQDEEFRDFFKEHFATKFFDFFKNTTITKPDPNNPKKQILALEAMPKIVEEINKMMSTFYEFVKKHYSDLIVLAPGDNQFLFDKQFITGVMMDKINGLTGLTEEYKTMIKEIMFNILIVPVNTEINSPQAKLNNLMEKMSKSLIDNQVNINKYNEYLLKEISKGITEGNVQEKTEMLSDVVSTLIKTIAMKKQLKGAPDPMAERFLDQADFNEIIDQIQYRELKSKLDSSHLNFIVDAFYNKISDSISRNDSTLENIYFMAQKRHKLYHTAMILTIVTVGVVWFNYTLDNISMQKYLYTDLVKKIDEKQKLVSTLRSGLNGLKDEEQKKTVDGKLKSQNYELELLYREKRNRTINWIVRTIMPLFVYVFLICILIAMYKKMTAVHDFNVDLIETNTNILKNTSKELKDLMDSLDMIISHGDSYKKIKEITNITSDHKVEIFKSIKLVIEKYEKCNFILEAQKSQLPFPYSDLAINFFMVVVCILCFFYVMGQLKPIARLKQIKELNKMKEESLIADKTAIKLMKKELDYLMTCHEDDIDAVIFTLKVVFFIFIITFLIFYSNKVISSAGEYQNGLYNSGFFENSVCIT